MLIKDDFAALHQWLRGTGAVHAREAVTDLISDHMINQLHFCKRLCPIS
jgi:hypothetical protein